MSLTDALVEVAPAGAWADITDDVVLSDGISIVRGRSEWGTQMPPTSLSLTLLNPGGKYSWRNPLATMPLPRNCPIRVSVRAGDSYLSIADTTSDRASTPDHATLDVTGDLDVRVEARLDEWISSDVQALLGKYNAVGNQRSWRLLLQNGKPFLAWSADGTTIIEKGATIEAVIPPSRRLALRAVLDVDNGAAGNTVRFYTAPSIAGPWTLLGDPVVTAGVTSVFAGTAPLEVGAVTSLTALAPVGEILAAEVRNAATGALVAAPDFTVQAPGTTVFSDSVGRTWTLAGDATLSNKRVRFTGELTSLPSDSHVSGHNIRARATAYGELRRYSKGGSIQQSTLRRRIPSGEPLAYWPLEDGPRTVRPASALSGGKPLTASGLDFAQADGLGGSAPLPTLQSSASISGVVSGAVSGGWHAEMVYKLDTMPATMKPLLTLYVSGAGSSVSAVHVRCSTTGIQVRAIQTDGDVAADATLSDANAIAAFTGSWNRLALFSYDDGPNCNIVAAWRDVVANSYWYAFVPFAGAPGRVVRVGSNWGADFQGMAIGHLAVWDTGATALESPSVTIYDGADDGYSGESALNRIARVAGEAELPMTTYDGDTSVLSQLVGPQGVDEALTLIESAGDVDGGILYEGRHAARLEYRDRSSLYNQVPIVLAYKGDGLTTPLEPAPDDQDAANDVTVTRLDGASARVVVEDGPRSVQLPPDGVGPYPQPYTLNLYTDEQAAPIAGWLAHLGTWDSERYPLVSVKLTAAPHPITRLSEVDIGARLQIDGAPAWRSPDPIDLIVQGYDEVIKPLEWEITFKCTPAGPWTVAEVETDMPGVADTDGSELAAAVDADDTTLSVATTVGEVWVQAPPALNTNVRAAADLAGSWFGNNATIDRVASPGVVPVTDGAWSIQITPNGSSASGGLNSESTAMGTVTPGSSYTVSCWAYSPGGWADLRACVDWLDAAGAYLTSGLGSATVVPAGEWTFLQQTFTAPASASRAQTRARHGGTPPSSAVWYVTQVTIRPTVSGQALDGLPLTMKVGGEVVRVEAITGAATPQTFTVVRSINGIAKAQTDGEPISLYPPPIVAL